MIPFLNLRAAYRELKTEIDEKIASILDGGPAEAFGPGAWLAWFSPTGFCAGALLADGAAEESTQSSGSGLNQFIEVINSGGWSNRSLAAAE